MCLIISREPSFEIPYDKFKTAIENNPHGFGFSYPDVDGKLKTYRSSEEPDPDKLYRLINEELLDTKLMLHLRYTTVGETILRNSHPFPILERGADGIDLRMAHNGTLSAYKPKGQSSESDTRMFVKNYVRPLFKRLAKGMDPEELMNDSFTKKILEDKLTAMSVLTFIDGNGNTLICNEEGNGGKKEDKWYYSNTYSFDPTHRLPSQSYYPYNQNRGSSLVTMGNRPSNTSGLSAELRASNTQKFTTVYNLKVDDLFSLSDDTLQTLTSSHTVHSRLLIKELLYELETTKKQLNAANRKLKKAG